MTKKRKKKLSLEERKEKKGIVLSLLSTASHQVWFAVDHKYILHHPLFQVSADTSFVIIIIVSRVFPTSFGSGLAAVPNTISFSTVFKDALTKLKENIHVIVTVLLFIILYLVLLPLAFRKDRTDTKNVSIVFMLTVPKLQSKIHYNTTAAKLFIVILSIHLFVKFKEIVS